mmetsp:Transcript_18790/g.36816  ORF Transcript_18790/g.36816 Transcript_18790/m.36816 type:complete len:572 (-) Transcript_18790:576-2291(-)|eukprot:CAMPEP_0171487106 /NCGR_PEP_ID=MMETSP0958-20121227/1461_1 /TAXON_ID=87120 /ORGANISM="Aurantiochytrium limacinum, Strain ATCCMYA-1381" /LENGTH=571 /DNA_ID=CAMNT_0012020059 /DNA_START=458 /DNA_END=2173 /DNA_ORIENTATION=+
MYARVTQARPLSKLEYAQRRAIITHQSPLWQIFGAISGLVFLGWMLLNTLWWAAVDPTVSHHPLTASLTVTDPFCELVADIYHTCKSNELFPTRVADGQLECDFNIAENLEYMPDAEIMTCLEKIKPLVWAKDAARLQRKIYNLQHPSDCKKPKSKDFLEPDWTPVKDKSGAWARHHGTGTKTDPSKPKWHLLNWLNHGWAYNLFVFSWSAQNHWNSGVPVLVGNSKYRFTDFKCGRGYSCELSELTSCEVTDVDPSSVLVYGIGITPKEVMTMDQLCLPHGKYLMEYGRCDCPPLFLPASDARYSFCQPYSAIDLTIERKRGHAEFYEAHKAVAIQGDEVWFANNAPGEENPHNTYNPVHFEIGELRKRHGFLWEHAQSIYYLLHNSRTKAHNDRIRERLGLTKPGLRCVAVHVRHGDSCHDKHQDHRVCLPLSNFMDGVRKLTQRYGPYDKVYLATDDPRVIKDAKEYEDEFNIVYQSQDRSFYETGDSEGVDVRGEFNEPDKVNEIASDIWAMGHCDAFVGSFASSVAWVAYEYMVARSGFYPPFVSVDLPYGHKKNVGRFLEEGPNM